MRIRSLFASLSALALLVSPRPAAAQDFQWHGPVAQGRAIEIKGVNGDIRAEPSGSNEVEVVAVKRATRDNPDSVKLFEAFGAAARAFAARSRSLRCPS